MKIKYILLLLCLSFVSLGYAQNAQFQILEKETNTPIYLSTLAWSSVANKADHGHGISDDNGIIATTCKPGQKIAITVQCLGYNHYSDTIIVKQKNQIRLESSIISMNEIVVVGKSKGQTLRESPETVTVIDGATLYGRAVSLESVLDKSVGIKIRQTGGLGSSSRIMIHGLEGNRVQLLIDGMPFNTLDGTFSIDDIPIDLIERIEVYKSIIPARFGCDGLGGAVNIVTREFSTDYVDISAEAGSYDTYKGSSIFRKNIPKQGILIGGGISYNYAENDYKFYVPDREELYVRRDHDLFKSYLVKGSIKFTKLWFDELSIEGGHYNRFSEIQGVQQNIQHAEQLSKNWMLENKFRKRGLLNSKLDFELHSIINYSTTNLVDTASMNYDFQGNSYPSPNKYGETGDLPHDSNDKLLDVTERLNIDYKLNYNHSINLNTLFRYSKKRPGDEFASQFAGYTIGGYPSTMRNLVTGLTYESKFLGGRIVNMFSAKHYYMHSEIEELSVYMQDTPELKKNTAHRVGFIESVKWEFLTGIHLKASYQRAIRLPNPQELFGDGITIFPASKLDPENSDNFNLGVLVDKSNLLGLHRMQFEMSGFYLKVNDMIKLMQQYRQMGYENVQKVEIKGIEAELKLDITRNLYAYGNVTYQDIRDVLKYEPGTTSLNPTKELRLPNIPYFFTNFGMEFHSDKLLGKNWYFKTFWDAQYTDEFFYSWELSKHQNRRIPSSFVNNLGLLVSYKNRYSISVECHNIGNVNVWNLYRTPLPGRSFHLKFRYTFSKGL